MKIALVCGGRGYQDARRAYQILDEEKPDMMSYDLRRALYFVREAIATVANLEDAP